MIEEAIAYEYCEKFSSFLSRKDFLIDVESRLDGGELLALR